MNVHLTKQGLIARALDKAVPETWNTLTYPQLIKFSDALIELTARKAIKACLDNDDPITATDIGNIFGIYE